jgi:hypothetical protein
MGAAAPLLAQRHPLPERARAQISALLADKLAWTPAQQKMDSQLIYAARVMRGEPMAAGFPLVPGALDRVRIDRQGIVTLDVKAAVDAALLTALRGLGGQILSAHPRYGAVRVQMPISRVEEVAALPGIRFVGPAQEPIFNRRRAATAAGAAIAPVSDRSASIAPARAKGASIASAQIEAASIAPARAKGASIAPAQIEAASIAPAGSITSVISTTQGDHAHAADLVRALGFNGAGVKVGVLSDGVDSLATQQAAGALPAVTVLTGQAGSGDEGTAILQIVHTLAPGAQLYYATGLGSDAGMASNIVALRAAGCAVIIDDVTYLDEGVFQDSPIAAAVETVTAQGALYFSSASNSGNADSATSGTWEGDFISSGDTLPGTSGAALDFGGGNPTNQLTGSAPFGISLKWSDPLGAATDDYDLFVLDALDNIVAFSTTRQNGTQDPYEQVGAQNAGTYLVVTRFSGNTRALHVDTERGRLQFATSGATFGHNAAAGAVSVAATNVNNAGGGVFAGGAQDPVEVYSSDGFRRIFYQPDGTPITPGNFLFGSAGGTLLAKPDLTAADCVDDNVPSFAIFCGTSAAAPHAGAIAALALSMPSHPGAAQVKAAMLSSALDIMAAGADRDSGTGVVMANRTVAALTPAPPPAAFYTVTPCRLVDTRNPAGPAGGPALQPASVRAFTLAGSCGIPAGAVAVAVNITVTQPAAIGDLRLYPADLPSPPLVSAINFAAGRTLASNSVVKLSATPAGAIAVRNDSTGTAHLILDVAGYFE